MIIWYQGWGGVCKRYPCSGFLKQVFSIFRPWSCHSLHKAKADTTILACKLDKIVGDQNRFLAVKQTIPPLVIKWSVLYTNPGSKTNHIAPGYQMVGSFILTLAVKQTIFSLDIKWSVLYTNHPISHFNTRSFTPYPRWYSPFKKDPLHLL